MSNTVETVDTTDCTDWIGAALESHLTDYDHIADTKGDLLQELGYTPGSPSIEDSNVAKGIEHILPAILDTDNLEDHDWVTVIQSDPIYGEKEHTIAVKGVASDWLVHITPTGTPIEVEASDVASYHLP